MELNVCLYCEKRLADESMAFCSMSCQSKEASKSFNDTYVYLQQPNTKLNNTYPISYHRRPSLTYSQSTSTINTTNSAISNASRQRKPSLTNTLLTASSITRPHYMSTNSLSTSTSFSSSLSSIISTP